MFEFASRPLDHRARAGLFHTPHGDLETPVFAPVGTEATVKALTPGQLEGAGRDAGARATPIICTCAPATNWCRDMGGLHHFMQWDGPMLTDSGGFQVFSLSDTRKIDDDGVTFKSHIDGSHAPLHAREIHRHPGEPGRRHHHGLRRVLRRRTTAPTARSPWSAPTRWAERCLAAKTPRRPGAVRHRAGRRLPRPARRSRRAIASAWTSPAIAIGGLAVGESKDEMHAMLDVVTPLLPEDKPRYLMGVGSPEDLVNGVLRGIDIFDCVLPTRLARNHAAFTRTAG